MAGKADILIESMERECPACGALPGERCKDKHNRDIMHGERITGQAPREWRESPRKTAYASSYISEAVFGE